MPRFIVERTFSQGLVIPANDEGARVCDLVVNANGVEHVTRLHSYVSADKKKTFCVYDGPDEAAIRRAAQKNDLPVDSVVAVAILDPYFHH
jgi:hypothetical protein